MWVIGGRKALLLSEHRPRARAPARGPKDRYVHLSQGSPPGEGATAVPHEAPRGTGISGAPPLLVRGLFPRSKVLGHV